MRTLAITRRHQQIPAVNFASAVNKFNYQLVGDFRATLPSLKSRCRLLPVIVGQPAAADIRLVFDKPLADDRYSLTGSDAIKDSDLKSSMGTRTQASRWQPTFPSGDGSEGGNFAARLHDRFATGDRQLDQPEHQHRYQRQ